MTENKPIIINGIDVSGCEYYDKNKKYCLTLKMDTTGFKNPSCFSGDFQECIQDSKTCPYTFCDNNHDCYFKQLTRKTQECERLKEENFTFKQLIKEYEKYGAIEEIIQQLDQLKAENDKYSLFIEKLCDYAGLECDSEEQATRTLLDFASQMYKAKVINDQLKAENEKLKTNTEMWKTIDITLGDGSIKTQISDMSLAEYSQLKLEKDRAEQKLEKIREICKPYIDLPSYEFVKILQILDEVE